MVEKTLLEAGSKKLVEGNGGWSLRGLMPLVVGSGTSGLRKSDAVLKSVWGGSLHLRRAAT
jgi:hypothetical protein